MHTYTTMSVIYFNGSVMAAFKDPQNARTYLEMLENLGIDLALYTIRHGQSVKIDTF